MSSTNMTSTTAGFPKGGRKSASLPPGTVQYLKAWMMSPDHVAHPYPTEQEKAQIMADTGIEPKRLANWFVNNRKRYWKPRVEAKLQKYDAPVGSMPSLKQVAGGLSIPTIPKSSQQHQQLHKQATATSLPMPAASLLLLARGTGGPARHSRANCYPSAEGVAPVQAAANSREDDPHTISEGSGSSACNSDDDSIGTLSADRRSSFVATSAQCLDSPLAAIRDSSSGVTTAVPMSGGYQRQEKSVANASFAHGFTIHVICPPSGVDGVNVKTSPHLPRSRTYESAALDQYDNNSNPAPRKRARTASKPSLKGVNEWRELCQNAESLFCESLPSLEEAAVMFGYLSQ